MRICWTRRERGRPGSRRWRAAARRATVVAALALLAGCATKPPPPYVPRQIENLKIVHCFDGVPHQPGGKPWILGGTCCCTPSDELMREYQRDGYCADMTSEDLLKLYQAKRIALLGDHESCNNLCADGPHVTQGGRCMVPPTPGTRQFERVVTGQAGSVLAGQRSRTESEGAKP